MAAALDISPQRTADARSQVIILTGPTAVGKTAASLKLARAVNGEIISADSVQVYRGLDIGSAKLPEHERQGIPHHLLDVADPADEFSAGQFFHEARKVTEEILQKGKTPVVVGGTGFYLRWYIYGKPNTPVSNEQLAAAARSRLDEAWEHAAAAADGGELTPQQKWQAGVNLIASLGDPESAEELKTVPNNYYRLLRVLEILLATGRPRSDLNLDTAAPLTYDFRCFFLDRPRAELYRRIDVRCEEMLRDGLLQECVDLLRRGFQPDDNSATRAIGYRQGLEFLLRWQADPETLTSTSIMDLLEAVQSASRQYAHSQIKWARGVQLFRWLDAAKQPGEIVTEIQRHLADKPYTGGSNGHGLLSTEEQREMKRYRTVQQILCNPELLQQLCTQTKAFLKQAT